ncbi:myb-like protein X isoform X1 [Battus philenor]
MSQLYLPWGTGEQHKNRLQVRNQFASTLELHKQESFDYQEPVQRQRSPSLPPIHHIETTKLIKEDRKYKEVLNRNVSSAKRFAFYDEDGEGDTSGYGSETINHMNIRNQRGIIEHNPVVAWQQDRDENRKQIGRTSTTNVMWSARSVGPPEEGRPRWGDRGVATGKLWEPTAPNERLPQMQNQKKGTPSWVERGLNMIDNASEAIVIDQRSSTNSGAECDRSSFNGSDEGKTFLRGQNIPLEPEIRAQRENKRIKALELQSAILSQLEDREKRRQEERERELKEERLEELRIQRQQEEDRLKIAEEKRKIEEKQILEQRKLECLRKAIEDAEKKARNEKDKKYVSHRQPLNLTVTECEEQKSKDLENATVESVQNSELISPTKSSRTYDVHTPKNQKKDCNSRQSTAFNSPRSLVGSGGNVNLFIHNVPPIALTENQFNIVPLGINGNGEIVSTQPNSLQLAVLVPQNLSNNLFSVSINSLVNKTEIPETERIVTPKKYRTYKTKDAFTQTETDCLKYKVDKNVETIDIERDIDKDYPNIDENAPQDGVRNALKKDRRLRSEERYKKDIENRPKWGANKPVAQYKKQSEKDPFYSQKRKVRQKYRPQARRYMSQSSEDSRSPSPPTRSEQIEQSNYKQRHSLSQSYWKNKRSNQDYTKNILEGTSVDQPEFCSLDQITGHKLDQMKLPKRLTLSQKFINDKYGSKKLWMDDIMERNTKYTNIDDVNSK